MCDNNWIDKVYLHVTVHTFSNQRYWNAFFFFFTCFKNEICQFIVDNKQSWNRKTQKIRCFRYTILFTIRIIFTEQMLMYFLFKDVQKRIWCVKITNCEVKKIVVWLVSFRCTIFGTSKFDLETRILDFHRLQFKDCGRNLLHICVQQHTHKRVHLIPRPYQFGRIVIFNIDLCFDFGCFHDSFISQLCATWSLISFCQRNVYTKSSNVLFVQYSWAYE